MRPKRHDVIHAILERAKDAKDAGINPNAWIQQAFGISRQQTTRYLTALCAEGLLQRHGIGPGVRYIYVAHRKLLLQLLWKSKEISSSRDSVLDEIMQHPSLKNLPREAQKFIQATLGVLLNNALDHSDGETIRLDLSLEDETLTLHFTDDGVGLFQHIAEHFYSPTLVEAVGDLVKGIRRHSSTSKFGLNSIFWAADFVRIEANGLQLKMQGRSQDWSLTQVAKGRSGTFSIVEFDPSTARPLQPKATQKVLIPVVLYSRNLRRRIADQRDAKRMLRGHWEHEEIILDFHKVEELNYSFMFDIFIRFKGQHPKCGLMPVNMNAGIRSMLTLIQKDKEPRNRQTRRGRT